MNREEKIQFKTKTKKFHAYIKAYGLTPKEVKQILDDALRVLGISGIEILEVKDWWR